MGSQGRITVSVQGVEHLARLSWPRRPIVAILSIECPICGRSPLEVQGRGGVAHVDRPDADPYFISFEPAALCCGARFDWIKSRHERLPFVERKGL